MAVVQLRFDGKYAYSTIANINQTQIIENHSRRGLSDANEEEEADNKQEVECICEHKKDLHGKCRSLIVSSTTTNSSMGNSRHSNNGHLCHSHMNGHSLNSATSSPTIKVCLCSYHTNNNNNNNHTIEECRQRSESIKVDNWDYIYRERAYLDVAHVDHHNAVPK